jgi:hypothetical protein
MLRMRNLIVTALTWFHGEYTVVADKPQARLVTLVCANPWLNLILVVATAIGAVISIKETMAAIAIAN